MVLALLALGVCGTSDGIPDGWWLKCKARPVKSFNEFQNLIQGELAHKFVFIDTYMEYCPYCFYCLDDFNSIVEDMTKWYGSESIAFIKIDGTRIREFSRRYKISSYPKFLVIYP
jgi:hypothetical protein